jgi:tight adherence protein B
MFNSPQIGPIVVVIAGGVALVMAILGVVLYQAAFGSRARVARRMQTMFGAPGQMRRIRDNAGAIAKKKPLSLKLKDQANANVQKKGYAENMRDRIQQAGLTFTLKQYFAASLGLAAVSEAVYYLMGFNRMGLFLVPLIAGLGLPMLVVSTIRNRRLGKFLLLFPDALDVITRGIKSGLPVGECITVIGREMSEPVASEFRIISESQKLAVPLDEALTKATERVPLAELRFLAIVMAIQQQTGGNLADTLGKLSDVIRARKKMRDKVKALSAEAKASAGIIGSLPIIVSGLLSMVAPDYIGELFAKEMGNNLLIAGMCLMALGIFVMRQMINFDI